MNRQFVSFKLERVYFGIPVQYVLEINGKTERTMVPGGAEYIAGLLNLRGDIVVMIDLRLKLGFEAVRSGVNLILRTEDEVRTVYSSGSPFISIGNERVGFVVDSVSNIVELPDEDLFDTPPVDQDRYEVKYISDVYRFNGELLMVLNIEQLIREELQAGASN